MVSTETLEHVLDFSPILPECPLVEWMPAIQAIICYFYSTEYVGLNLGQQLPKIYTCAWSALPYDCLLQGGTLTSSDCFVANTLLAAECLVCKELASHFCVCVIVANGKNLYFFLRLGQSILKDLSVIKDRLGLYYGSSQTCSLLRLPSNMALIDSVFRTFIVGVLYLIF